MQSRQASLMAKVLLRFIALYRNYLSINMLHSCRFWPTCSDYAKLAIQKDGAVKGSLAAASRLLRCHPFCHAGVDPVR